MYREGSSSSWRSLHQHVALSSIVTRDFSLSESDKGIVEKQKWLHPGTLYCTRTEKLCGNIIWILCSNRNIFGEGIMISHATISLPHSKDRHQAIQDLRLYDSPSPILFTLKWGTHFETPLYFLNSLLIACERRCYLGHHHIRGRHNE